LAHAAANAGHQIPLNHFISFKEAGLQGSRPYNLVEAKPLAWL
jgi:hypothetical protein